MRRSFSDTACAWAVLTLSRYFRQAVCDMGCILSLHPAGPDKSGLHYVLTG